MIQNLRLTAILIIFTFAGCSKDSAEPLPELKLTSTTVNEGATSATKAEIKVSLSKVFSKDVTFDYAVSDGTAKSGFDYSAFATKSATIKAGQLSTSLEVVILPDDIFEFNETLYVTAENIQNATASFNKATVTIVDDDIYTPETDANGVITPNNYPGMSLVWSDEFNDATLNLTNWSYEKGASGWGNNELEDYTDSPNNVFVENGFLNIKAIKEGAKYTSGRIITKGKREFTYGRIDIRAKLPVGQGIWPALWMLGSNIETVSWPGCGEIDIMEYLGHEHNKVYGTAHYNDNGHKYEGSNYTLIGGGFEDKFHVFTLMWQENSMVWYVDYQKFFQFNKAGNTFNKNQFFIMNLAVGGNWPGNPDATTVFPQTMQVDYVRIFQ